MIQIVELNAENFEHVVKNHDTNLISLQRLIHHEKLRTSETLLHQIGAINSDGELVGFGLAVSGHWDPVIKMGHFQIEVRVDSKWRKQGIGDRIFQNLKNFALIHDANLLKAYVSDNQRENLKWAEQRGFVNNQHVFASRLDLSQFSYAKFNQTIEKTKKLGITFTPLSTYPNTDEWFERFINFYYDLVEDVPGMEPHVRPKLSELQSLYRDADNWDPSGIILATFEDEWVAMSWVASRPDGDYYNQMTGVQKKFRNKGIGISVKLNAIEYVQKQKSHFLYTHNDSNNKPMLQINQRLGFESTHGVYWLTCPI